MDVPGSNPRQGADDWSMVPQPLVWSSEGRGVRWFFSAKVLDLRFHHNQLAQTPCFASFPLLAGSERLAGHGPLLDPHLQAMGCTSGSNSISKRRLLIRNRKVAWPVSSGSLARRRFSNPRFKLIRH